MNILMVGLTNAKGSWEIRGIQLGAALGARVTTAPTAADWRWADLIVLIKRAWVPWLAEARAAKVPIVWDALDCWRQPAENQVSPAKAKDLLLRQIATIRPALTLCATEAQATACGGVYLPHHSWAGLTPTQAREVVSTVCYEGNPSFLGRWGQAVKTECDRRGWSFVLNPPDLSVADIIVAFRDAQWDGWICREWKSGVKLVNAIAAGRPIITQESAAVRELCPARSVIESTRDLAGAFDRWSYIVERDNVVKHYAWMPSFSLDVIAERYRQILQTVGQPCVA